MDGLPLELVTTIFRLLFWKDRIATSHVCKRWRGAAIEDTTLWARLSSDFLTLDGFEALVSRSREAPLWLNISAFTDSEVPRIARILSGNMARIRSLLFQTCRTRYSDEIQDALCTPAPLLESFTIYAPDEDEITLPRLLFGGEAARLTSLKLHAVHLPLECPGLADVAFFRFRVFDTSPPVPFYLSDVLPRIKGLELSHLSGNAHVSLNPNHKLFQLELETRDHLRRDVRHHLVALHHERFTFISATTMHQDTLSLVLGSLHDATVVCFGFCDPDIDKRWNDEACTTVNLSIGSLSRLRQFPVVYWQTVLGAFSTPARFASVRTFNVARHLLHMAPPLLPNVQRLSVEFPSEDDEMEYADLALWLEPARSPKLGVLVLNGERQVGAALGHRPLTRTRLLNAARLSACLSARGSPLREFMLGVHMEEAQETVLSLLSPTATIFAWFPPGEESGIRVTRHLEE